MVYSNIVSYLYFCGQGGKSKLHQTFKLLLLYYPSLQHLEIAKHYVSILAFYSIKVLIEPSQYIIDFIMS